MGPVVNRRIALTTPRYPPFVGGTETHVFEVGRRLAGQGFEVSVLTTDPRGDLAPVSRQEEVTVRRFPVRPRSGDLCWAPRLLDAVRTGGFDLVHVQGAHTLLAPTVLSAAQRAGIATVITFHTGGHSSRIRSALRGAQWRTLRHRLRAADAMVAVSEHERATFARAAACDHGSIRLIRNGTVALPVGGGPSQFSGEPLVVSVGRLERYKGHQHAMAAVAELRRRRPGVRLVVVGRGRYEKQLRRLAKRLGIDGTVSFASFDHEDRGGLGALISASDVVLLMSEYEAHPVAVAEALGLGRRVVVAEAPGLSELGGHDLVTVVDPACGPSRLAAVIEEQADAPAGTAPVLPTWDDTAAELAALYAEVLERRPAPARR